MSSPDNKVNPFELDCDGEDFSYDWNEDDAWQEKYGTEDERLMQEYNRRNVSNSSWSYCSDRRGEQQRSVDPVGKRPLFSYHSYSEPYGSGSGNYDLHHKPRLWKFGSLAIVLILALFFWNQGDNVDSNDYVSMIDEIPNDEYRLIILGERHSGTSWLQARLHECFPHAFILSSLQRPGFLFQDEPAKDEFHNSEAIVIHLTLNIYDWVEQMRMSPEYAPNHVGIHKEGHVIPLPWDDFLSKPWTMDRPERDFALRNITDSTCQFGFQYDQVVSCAEKPPGGPDNPIYELNSFNGSPYDSILSLRAAKLRNHQTVQKWKIVKKFLTHSYEHIGKEFKSRVLNEIKDFTGWAALCSGDVLPPSRERTASMSTQYVEYVTQNADWEAEGLVSYKPWTVSDIREKGIQKSSDDLKRMSSPPPTSVPTTFKSFKDKDSNKKNEEEKSEPNPSIQPSD
ncbi:hypothetical protein IV203_016846 [Nitzschia inconspicua]|uniref:Sulfotransferase n=1 Tax=Nitzschia inconspicua TaxID=303405 RepID=A0A9K3KR94_9STRA|nr:hypothetical protein IV203_016846 [Nitzschia inconspicua]